MGHSVDNLAENQEVDRKCINIKNTSPSKDYMGTRRAKVTVHGLSVDITEDKMQAFFYPKVEVEGVISKAGFATSNTTYMQEFRGQRRMLVVVEGRRLYWRPCGALGYMTKVCPGKNVTPQRITTATPTATVEAESGKAPNDGWKEVVAKSRAGPPSLLNEFPPKQKQPPKEQPEGQL